MQTIKGVIHGNVIELSEATGLAEGQEVTVRVEPVAPPLAASAALKREAGSRSDALEGSKQRTPGLHAGAIQVAPDFDAPLPDDFWAGPQ